jgi:hypothetical protein
MLIWQVWQLVQTSVACVKVKVRQHQKMHQNDQMPGLVRRGELMAEMSECHHAQYLILETLPE